MSKKQSGKPWFRTVLRSPEHLPLTMTTVWSRGGERQTCPLPTSGLGQPRQVRIQMIPSAAQTLIDRLHAASRERATTFKAVSFGLIGFFNTAVDLGVFSFGYYVLGLPIVVANLISWAFAVTGSYVLNSTITFSIESRRALSLKTYATFIVAQLAGLAANTTTVVIASHFMPVLFGKVLATGVSFMVNFSLSHFVVFKRPAASPLQD
jgi:putative flippase GtrA